MTVDKFIQMCRLYMDIVTGESTGKDTLDEFERLYLEATVYDHLEFARFVREFRRTRKKDV